MFCFIFQHKSFTLLLKISEVELWGIFSFTKEKIDHKVLIFGSKSSKFSTNCKYNRNMKVKAIVNVHVCNDLDMLFW